MPCQLLQLTPMQVPAVEVNRGLGAPSRAGGPWQGADHPWARTKEKGTLVLSTGGPGCPPEPQGWAGCSHQTAQQWQDLEVLVALPGASHGNGASPNTVAESHRPSCPMRAGKAFMPKSSPLETSKESNHQVLNGLSPTDPETWPKSCLIP